MMALTANVLVMAVERCHEVALAISVAPGAAGPACWLAPAIWLSRGSLATSSGARQLGESARAWLGLVRSGFEPGSIRFYLGSI